MKAKDIMTSRVITVGPDETVAEIAKVMIDQRISAVPVVDDQGRPVGIVSEGDLMRRRELGTDTAPRSWWLHLWRDAGTLADEFAKAHGKHARDVMTAEIITVDEDASVQAVAEAIEKNRIKRVPVLRDGKIVGIVSRANIVQKLAATKELDIEIYWDDAAIKDLVERHLEQQPWASVGTTSVTVTDGVVEFWGSVETDKETKAAITLAEEVPGVKNVRDHRTVRPTIMVSGY